MKAFIDREYSRCEDFSDYTILAQQIRLKNKNIQEQTVSELLQKVNESFVSTNKGFMVRMVVAGLIEEKYSEADRAEYLLEVVRGGAN